MRIRRLVVPFLFALALFEQRAEAFIDPPYVAPANPIAGDLISVNVRAGECDLVNDGVVWPPPVTQQGNAITILFTGIHEEDPEFCYFTVATRAYPVGVYPAGSYTLHVERRYGTLSGWTTETLGVIPLIVSGAPPQQPIETPTLSISGLAGLLLILIATALVALRMHKVQSP